MIEDVTWSHDPAPSLDTGTRLAAERTRLAHERTLMAWVRTATSLISFGFTIYKFFEFEAGRGGPATSALLSPRAFAMLMIATADRALVQHHQHRHSMRMLRADFGPAPRSVSAVSQGSWPSWGCWRSVPRCSEGERALTVCCEPSAPPVRFKTLSRDLRLISRHSCRPTPRRDWPVPCRRERNAHADEAMAMLIH